MQRELPKVLNQVYSYLVVGQKENPKGPQFLFIFSFTNSGLKPSSLRVASETRLLSCNLKDDASPPTFGRGRFEGIFEVDLLEDFLFSCIVGFRF